MALGDLRHPQVFVGCCQRPVQSWIVVQLALSQLQVGEAVLVAPQLYEDFPARISEMGILRPVLHGSIRQRQRARQVRTCICRQLARQIVAHHDLIRR